MRCVSVVVLLLFVYPAAALAGPPLTPRPVDRWAGAVFALARERSAAVREMVSELEASNVIVHIESSRLLPLGVGGTTRFVTSQGGHRYVRIALSVTLPPADRIAMLGHELQHALELARSDAADLAGVRRLFNRDGYYAVRGVEYFETQEALRVERRIRGELRTPEPPASVASRHATVPDK